MMDLQRDLIAIDSQDVKRLTKGSPPSLLITLLLDGLASNQLEQLYQKPHIGGVE